MFIPYFCFVVFVLLSSPFFIFLLCFVVPAGRLTGGAESLPVGFWVTGRPSGEVLSRLSLPVERKTPPEGFRWEIVWFRWKPVITGMPPEATKYHQKLFRWKNTVSGEFWVKFVASGENSVRHLNTEGGVSFLPFPLSFLFFIYFPFFKLAN